jgi:hypothetical protein
MRWKGKTAAAMVWAATAAWVAVLLASLRYGLLDRFFFDSSHAHVQGIDFFPVVRAFLSILNGHSAYDTFSVNYGPYATWFLYHPLLALTLGPLLAWMQPWTGYAAWTAASFVLMAIAAWLMMRLSSDPLRRALVGLVMLGAFPVYSMLYVGNVQALTVLAVTLVLVGLARMAGLDGAAPCDAAVLRRCRVMLLAGLLISLFSKPVVLLMLPLLWMMPETRRTAWKAFAIYAAVSLAFVAVPLLNPEGLGWSERIFLASHPAIVQQTMNVYTNGFTVTPPMKDNAVHWFAMVALADYRLLHIDVYSLPVFLDSWLHVHTPEALYRLPAILILEFSVMVAFLRGRRARLEAALHLTMAASLSYLVMYSLVWEYHYTAVLPVLGLILVRKSWNVAEKAVLALGALVCGPSLYFLVSGQNPTLLTVQNVIRLDRVLPAAAIFLILLGMVAVAGWRQWGALILGRGREPSASE